MAQPGVKGPDTGSGGTTDWRRVSLTYLAGVIAAVGLGKIAVAGPQISADLHLSLSELGWGISALLAVCAAAGLPAGLLINRLGAGRALAGGLVVITVAGVLGLIASGFTLLLVSRLVEGAGYLLVIVSCPALITQLAAERDRATALSIWGTFVPVGIGLSTLAGGVLGSLAGWRGWAGFVAGVTLILAVLVRMWIPARLETVSRVDLPPPRTLVRPTSLAAAFCLISMFTLSVIVLLPTYLSEEHRVAPVTSGLLTTVISLLSVVGGVAASMLLHRGVSLRVLALSGLIIVPAAWPAFADGTGFWTALAGSGAISLGNGLLVAVVFAGLPRTLARLGHADVGNGIVAQLGSLGSLLGPPLFGAIVAGGGWSGVIPLIGVGVAVAVAVLAALM